MRPRAGVEHRSSKFGGGGTSVMTVRRHSRALYQKAITTS